MLFAENTIVIEDLLDPKVVAWLEENCSLSYVIKPYMVCTKHVFAPTPTNKNEYKQRGWLLVFESEEDMMAYKLQWL